MVADKNNSQGFLDFMKFYKVNPLYFYFIFTVSPNYTLALNLLFQEYEIYDYNKYMRKCQ